MSWVLYLVVLVFIQRVAQTYRFHQATASLSQSADRLAAVVDEVVWVGEWRNPLASHKTMFVLTSSGLNIPSVGQCVRV